MKKSTFTLHSSDGKSTLSGFLFEPEGEERAVVQLCHGMCEYIMRYEALARHLTDAGYVVCGIDHLGHGSTAEANGEMLGYFGEKGAWNNLVEDQELERRAISERYPGLPYFLLGHSMGSFVARLYAARYGSHLQALLLSGTAGKNPAVGAGKLLVSLITLLKGRKGTSKLLYQLTTGNYNKATEHNTPVDWICHDEQICRRYMEDPWCRFIFTNSGFGELMQLVDRCNRPEWFAAVPKDLPVWLYAGDEDAVGDCGRGVTEVYEGLKAQGLRDVTITLYPGARHEVHNEPIKATLFRDLVAYLEAHMPAKG